MGNLITTHDPCELHFQQYIRCVKECEGKHPSLYEEFCEVEKGDYIECRYLVSQGKPPQPITPPDERD